MPARSDLTLEEFRARQEQRRRQNREAQQRFRTRRKHHADGVSITGKHDAAPEYGALPSLVSMTPPLPPDPPFFPALSTKEPPPEEVLARIAARLQAFGRGYKHDQARLEKLIRDFPHLDVEEEVADGLDFLDRPENRKRVNSLGFHRNGCKRAEARRVADAQKAEAVNGVGALRGVVTNGTYHPPIAFQHNRQPPSDDDHLPLRELVPIAREDFARTVAANRGLTLEQKRARLTARLNGHAPEGGKA